MLPSASVRSKVVGFRHSLMLTALLQVKSYLWAASAKAALLRAIGAFSVGTTRASKTTNGSVHHRQKPDQSWVAAATHRWFLHASTTAARWLPAKRHATRSSQASTASRMGEVARCMICSVGVACLLHALPRRGRAGRSQLVPKRRRRQLQPCYLFRHLPRR